MKENKEVLFRTKLPPANMFIWYLCGCGNSCVFNYIRLDRLVVKYPYTNLITYFENSIVKFHIFYTFNILVKFVSIEYFLLYDL